MRSVIKRLKTVAGARPVRFVFVCTANCTRSPLAEILFEKLLVDETGSISNLYAKNIVVESAGIFSSGFAISQCSKEMLMREEGVSAKRCDAHVGRGIAEIEEPDLVLTMSCGHAEAVLEKFPSWKGRVFLFDDFVNRDAGIKGNDIDDPTGFGFANYAYMKKIVRRDLELLVKELKDEGFI